MYWKTAESSFYSVVWYLWYYYVWSNRLYLQSMNNKANAVSNIMKNVLCKYIHSNKVDISWHYTVIYPNALSCKRTRCAKQYPYIKDLSKCQLPHSTPQGAFVLTVSLFTTVAFRAKSSDSDKQQCRGVHHACTMRVSCIPLIVRVLLTNDKQHDSPINFRKPLNSLNYGVVLKPFRWVQ
jgi:hypothetical protein